MMNDPHYLTTWLRALKNLAFAMPSDYPSACVVHGGQGMQAVQLARLLELARAQHGPHGESMRLGAHSDVAFPSVLSVHADSLTRDVALQVIVASSASQPVAASSASQVVTASTATQVLAASSASVNVQAVTLHPGAPGLAAVLKELSMGPVRLAVCVDACGSDLKLDLMAKTLRQVRQLACYTISCSFIDMV